MVSIIDDQVFGDLKSFREQFSDLSQEQVFATLKKRLAPLCHRTLRRQVTAYVSYTKRLPLLEHFTPDESEDRLYTLVSDYLQRDNLRALPAGQRTLMTLVMRKLLASSTFAIAGALGTLIRRLRATLAKQAPPAALAEDLNQDYESLDETAEEWDDDTDVDPRMSDADREALAREIAELEAFRDLATSITNNAKGEALLKALRVAFERRPNWAARRRRSSSPSRERPRCTCSASWPTAPGKTAWSSSTARTRTSSPERSLRSGGTGTRGRTRSRGRRARTCALPWLTTSASAARS